MLPCATLGAAHCRRPALSERLPLSAAAPPRRRRPLCECAAHITQSSCYLSLTPCCFRVSVAT
jgi:hypothetical protein